jgi:hypothetical protein
MDKDTSKPKKKSAKLIMQQRHNIHTAKNKLVNYVKETHIEPIKKDLAAPREPRAKFGEGKLATYLGLDPGSNEDRPEIQPVKGALDNYIHSAQNTPEYKAILPRSEHFDTGATEHLPEGVVSLNKYRESKAARKGY